MRVFERRAGSVTRRSADVHAKRIDALWRISTGWADGEHVPVDAILAESVAVLRPGHAFAARLCRVEDAELLVESAVGAYFAEEANAFVTVGKRLLLAEVPQLEVIAERRTRAWSDLRLDPVVAGRAAVRDAGWRALIATSFDVARTQYALSFLSPEPLERPFDREDETFVEIIAAYLGRTLQASVQAERLRYQMQHDPLTGLVNRTRFRMLLNETLSRHEHCGLAIVDLFDLDAINERLGYMTGDALLVEVGAALARCNRDGEFTGRLYGDSFGIAFPHVSSREQLERRLAAYAGRFAAPFATGDRNNVERVCLTARLGCAFAPDDGRTADALLVHAAGTLIFGP